jgi:hypothetical protein
MRIAYFAMVVSLPLGRRRFRRLVLTTNEPAPGSTGPLPTIAETRPRVRRLR